MNTQQNQIVLPEILQQAGLSLEQEIQDAAAVPEPGTYALMGSALLGLGALARCRCRYWRNGISGKAR